MSLCIMATYLYFGPACSEDIVPEVLRFVQMKFNKPKLCSHVSLKRTSDLFILVVSLAVKY